MAALAADDRRLCVPHVELGHGRVLVAQRLGRRLLRGLLVPGPCRALLLPPRIPEGAAWVAAPGEPQGGHVAPRHHANHFFSPAAGVLVPMRREQPRIHRGFYG